METERRSIVFVVRMWVQAGHGTAAPEWRGSVSNVADGVLRYVSGSRDVADFIDARLADGATRRREPDG